MNASSECKQRLHLDQLKALAKTQIPFIEREGGGGFALKIWSIHNDKNALLNNFNYL
jgi:hypothetical protein